MRAKAIGLTADERHGQSHRQGSDGIHTGTAKAYKQFVSRYPKLGEAWDCIAEAGADGPLDERTCR
jgi:hypothetical protein